MRPAPDTPTARHALAACHTLAAPAHSELIIKKSRFIGCVQPMADRASAQAAIAALWRQHPGATHVCWALRAGGQSAAVDDGEPGGTAGRPMLQVLQHQALDAVLASVVRYFGGVKLGAGALLRAYTDTIAQALRNAPKVSLQPMQTLHCQLPYALEGWLRREIEAAGAQLLAVQHGARVTLQLRLPQAQAARLMQRVNDNGQGLVEWCPAPR
ncbi:IMPACT family protein [Verminephrobacter eiseniae]|uniref:IMPACT family protein n=1 Tax=Verminephrobacter eiseniae TaxID=364317 RepID=UPI002237C5FF|nr:YigZ family protein [Verminephrobacter eiseniae]MCW5231039.1 YigZ family protein [Verminephrobacter eiseniae]MCW5292772.1 YigZ family protein [Verminephrobacter eiseniae]MCW8184665.1 YigZ family protein [Verminephrobacter eiseniae]MCW8223341.1 YigZ family protein [Verminephrobacter eiseniae]MCW8234532.1 YigZ family protein [Verminephrobacter eiseniae]